ncbi:MAG TPA: DNA repair protein RecO [Syntrophales bacterium]|nr:DNA repair protein RecO [Syntrophales bacterium]
MNTKTAHKSPAIVLYCLDYGESDRIVTFYTSDFGKIKGIAKGARRSKKRFSNALEPFSHGDVLYYKKGRGTLAFIEGFDIIDHFTNIREELEKTLISSYLIELVDKFTPEGKKNTELFHLLRNFLELIDTGNSLETLIRFFEIRLLKVTGYEPVLDRCMICKNPVNEKASYRFIVNDGGLRCDVCRQNNSGHLDVSLGTIKTLLLGKEIEIDRITRIVLSEQIAKESKNILVSLIYHLVGKEIKSLHVLNEIRKIGM